MLHDSNIQPRTHVQSQTKWLGKALSQRAGLLLILGLLVYRLSLLATQPLNLQFDEAQYWLWSKSLAWGYFSKPPMLAWFLAIYQSLFGEQVWVLKSMSTWVYTVTAIGIYGVAHTLYSPQVALYSALLFLTMPGVSLASVLISTDACFMLFWVLSVWMVAKAVFEGWSVGWLWGGVFAGLGLLSKYTMVLFLPSCLLYVMTRKNQKVPWTMIVTASVIALVIWAPNLYWNWMNKMSSFKHLAEISQVSQSRFHLSELTIFLIAQIGVLGIGSSALLVWHGALHYKREKQDAASDFCACFFIVFLSVITMQAFISRAFANWAAPCYATAVVWLCFRLHQTGGVRALNITLVINVLTMILMYHYAFFYQVLGVELHEKNDPMRAVRGWDQLGFQVGQLLHKYPQRRLLVDNRKTFTELVYYITPHPFDAQLFNPTHQLKNHFHLVQDLNQYREQDFLWVTQKEEPDFGQHYFGNIQLVEKIEVPIYAKKSKHYNVFLADGFKGYDYNEPKR